jgi:shikimate dehydrogenase
MQYGLIGEHLTHSFSKEIHQELGQYLYELQELTPAQLSDFLTEKDFCGINVTIPYKQDVIPFLSEISEAAKQIGAVNTVVNKNGKLYGYNTDFDGLKALIQNAGISLQGKKVLILGTGGTSHTAKAVAESLGAASVYKVSRSQKQGALTYDAVMQYHTDSEILINTTPCGMFGAASGMAVDPALFPRLCGVIDAVYNPLRSPLVQRATRLGVPAQGGLYMLVMQAVKAAELFFDVQYPIQTIESVYQKIKKSKENIVLTGMPASGKSTVGKLLAGSLNRPFIDTDVEIETKAGMPISRIFAEQGEGTFRQLETAVIKETAAKNGVIIATGGGAILRQENVDALKSNGKLIFLNRPLELLIPTDDRPLAGTKEAIEQRFSERFTTYLATADGVVDGAGTPEQVARLVEKEFLL